QFRSLPLWFGAALGALSVQPQLMAQTPGSVLPMPPAPFAGTIGNLAEDSRPSPILMGTPQAPAHARNILLFMSYDRGVGMSSSFGGLVPTPNMDRLAAAGQRYNRFHTTGICSPSRAALLTGRNHHTVRAGYLGAFS